MSGNLTTALATSVTNSTSPFNNNFTFPDRPSCFYIDDGIILNEDCAVAPSMLNFLNITTPKSYFQAYCIDPPDDSCAFGFCPNPDIAGPAVRYSTYVTNICLALVVWYEPDDAKDSFYAQILTVYSLVISAVIAITEEELTKVHALFALIAAASPLSIYLSFYALKSCFGYKTRLQSVFGTHRWVNRVITLIIVPVWIALLVFITLAKEAFHFQQAACEEAQQLGETLFVGPLILLFTFATIEPIVMVGLGAALLPFVGWVIGIYLKRKEIWDGSTKFPFKGMWKIVMKHYPFIEFCIALVIPHVYWLLSLEIGSFYDNEEFEADYGQLLAIFVAVPPVISVFRLIPRCGRWFGNLSWVRFVRRAGPRYERTSDSDLEPSDDARWSDRFQYTNELPLHAQNFSTYSLDTLTGTARTGERLKETAGPGERANAVSLATRPDSDGTKYHRMSDDEIDLRTPTRTDRAEPDSGAPRAVPDDTETWNLSPSPWVSLEP